MFTLCALFYGDHSALTKSLLDSLTTWGDLKHVTEYRFGLNEVSYYTRERVEQFCKEQNKPFRLYVPPNNVGKYPLMAQMFHDTDAPLTTKYVTWFDDDSRLNGKSRNVFADAAKLLGHGNAMIGKIYTKPFEGRQRDWIQNKPWYKGVPWQLNKSKNGTRPGYRFVTGGWWAIDTKVITDFGWPDPELHHNGGDVLLGELLRQQGLRIADFHQGLWINSGPQGRHSSAPRRGITQIPAGKKWEPGQEPDYSHYNFKVTVKTEI